MSLARHALTAAGAALAGSALYPYLKFLFEPGMVEIIAGLIVTVLATLWGNRSNAPVALAQKLVENPLINNQQAASAIAAGAPERVVVQSTPQPETAGAKKS